MFGDEEEIGFVICASCGARIKANRERCLRCEAPLVAWQKPELLPSWVQRLGGGTLIFGIVAIVGLAVVVTLFIESRSGTPDDVARPTSRARTAPPAPPDAAGLGAVPLSGIEPVDFLDIRRGTADLSGDVATARTKYTEALEKSPDNPELLNNLGLALERMNQIDAAIVRFERATQVDPQNWAYHFNLAHAISQRRGLDRAVAEYRIAAELLPTNYATHYNLGMTLRRKGEELAAIPVFQKGIEIAPTVAPFRLALAVSFEALGRNAEAQQEFQAYLDMVPGAPNAGSIRSHLQSLTARSGS
jgi:tetratricopeptide (TPR) repeat protein